MALFSAERIRKREFGREISAADKETLLEGARFSLTAHLAGHGLAAGKIEEIAPEADGAPVRTA